MTLECEELLQRAKIPHLRLTYEQLIEDFGTAVRRALDFSGLGLTDEDLVQSPGVEKPRPLSEHLEDAVNVRPLFRKGVVGDWRNHLKTDEAKDIVKELAGDLLIELGYESDYRW
jgi:hypothetical protein